MSVQKLRELESQVKIDGMLKYEPVKWFTDLEELDMIKVGSKHNWALFEVKEVNQDGRYVVLMNHNSQEHIYRDSDIIQYMLDVYRIVDDWV